MALVDQTPNATEQQTRQKWPKMTTFTLEHDGLIVIPVLSAQSLAKWRREITDDISNFPEFTNGTEIKDTILGGFSALGNPSSFHCPAVRKLRAIIHAPVSKFFVDWKPRAGRKLEQIVDRLMVRPAGRTPSAESFHRDICPKKSAGDAVYGGWICLDDKPQYFSCCPGSHLDTPTDGKTGFASISKEEAKVWKTRSVKVEVPPGHLLVFCEDIVHELNATKLKYDSFRLFCGWRLTHSSEPLLPGTLKTFEDQGVMQLKSHQFPRVFPKLLWVNWKSKLTPFDKSLKTECRVKVKCKKSGQEYVLPHELNGHMKSLRELGLGMYPAYGEAELRKHVPQVL